MIKYIFSLLVVVSQLAIAQTKLPAVEKAYAQFENDSQLKYGLSSLTVMNAQTSEVVFSKNGNIGLAPASTLKTVTSITAFHILGADFKWQTTLGFRGEIINGVLNGDLVIKGGGDPSLGSDRFEQTNSDLLLGRWLDAIKAAGIKKVNGKIVGDDSLFGTQITPLGWIWQDIGNYYGAGATSLSWKENQFGVKFNAGAKAGDKTVLLETAAMSPKITFINEVLTGAPGSGDNVYAYSAPYTDIVYLRGTYGLDLKKTIMVSMPDAALNFAEEFRKSLTFAGVTSQEATTTRRLNLLQDGYSRDIKVIDTYSSPALAEVIYWFNQKSINLYGENILKTIALKQGKMASTENGVSEVQKFWKNKLGIDQNAVAILDGSGLSPENRITSLAMTSIFQSAVKEPWFKDFYRSLPLNNAMRMKSGSIRNALAYSGFHKSSSGATLVFSFISNNYNGSTSSIKQKMFRVLDTLK